MVCPVKIRGISIDVIERNECNLQSLVSHEPLDSCRPPPLAVLGDHLPMQRKITSFPPTGLSIWNQERQGSNAALKAMKTQL
jgi:hypothetical protein